MANIQVVGIKDTLKDLRTFDPQARKQFARDAKQIAAPITNEAKSKYPQLPLSGMRYRWRQRGRDLLPWDARRARSGVTVKIDAGRRRNGVITIIQKDPAASIIEFANNNNRLGRSLSTLAWGAPARVMWPAADSHLKDVTREMKQAIDKVADDLNRKLIY
jgi:hypothetical protein